MPCALRSVMPTSTAMSRKRYAGVMGDAEQGACVVGEAAPTRHKRNCTTIPEIHCMFIGSGVAFGLTPEPVISDGHHSGAERGSQWKPSS
jgi:hypothetical protein